MTRQSTIAVAGATLTMAVAVGTALAIVQRAIPPAITSVLDQLPISRESAWQRYGVPVTIGAGVLMLGIWALHRSGTRR